VQNVRKKPKYRSNRQVLNQFFVENVIKLKNQKLILRKLEDFLVVQWGVEQMFDHLVDHPVGHPADMTIEAEDNQIGARQNLTQ
jgi:hypothetical protein